METICSLDTVLEKLDRVDDLVRISETDSPVSRVTPAQLQSSAPAAKRGNEAPSNHGKLRLVPIAASEYAGDHLLIEAGNASRLYQCVKRTTDVAGAIVLLVLFSPIMLVTLIALAITTQGKPIFRQERVGLCGRRFPMFKFRTMHVNAAQMQHLVKNEKDGPIFKNKRDPRITKIGRWLRATSIDEMPQLFNILLGHMSLVGPRPPVPSEVAKYEPWQRARLTIKPGLTCLWQVSGRCEVGFEDWVRMDIWYRKNQSLLTDLKLLIKTPLSVLSQRGAY